MIADRKLVAPTYQAFQKAAADVLTLMLSIENNPIALKTTCDAMHDWITKLEQSK